MDIWDQLGINPTEDSSVIKKAYVQKLKQHHPEEDPEGYQKLREAYDRAIMVVKRKRQAMNHSTREEDVVFLPSLRSLHAISHQRTNQEELVEVFMEKVHEVYQDYASRIEPASWLNLLQEDVMWNIRLQKAVREQMSVYIEQHPYLPREVWRMLNDGFHWTDTIRNDADSFAKRFPTIFLHVFADPHYISSLRYTYIEEFAEVDAFLEYRLKALIALKENNMQLTEAMLTKAHTLFADDPDLLRLRGEFYLRQSSFPEALEAIERCIRIVPNELDLYMYRARIHFEKELFTKAILDLQHILSLDPEHLDALSLAGKCYRRLREQEQAKEMYQRIIHIQPLDIEAVIQLAELEAKRVNIR
ncbi:J domain-containing protein [Paenibacillus sp. RC67]|uniref:J domain-containing protein n=1 Tax=Paenibacillus sp. RC67 TaxID=3039392 RepID=UPI0024AE269C|nr:J domain-containing protein [Paenibacillus sp. RC67]